MATRRGFLRRMVQVGGGLLVADDAEELLVEISRKLWPGASFDTTKSEFVWQPLPPGQDRYFAFGKMYFEVWGAGGSGGKSNVVAEGGGGAGALPLTYELKPADLAPPGIPFIVGGGGGAAESDVFRTKSATILSPEGPTWNQTPRRTSR